MGEMMGFFSSFSKTCLNVETKLDFLGIYLLLRFFLMSGGFL